MTQVKRIRKYTFILFTKHRRKIFQLPFMLLIFAGSYLFLNNNAYMYEQPIAKITKVQYFSSQNQVLNRLAYDSYYHQVIEATFLNTSQKWQRIRVDSEYTLSKAFNDY